MVNQLTGFKPVIDHIDIKAGATPPWVVAPPSASISNLVDFNAHMVRALSFGLPTKVVPVNART